MKENNNYPDYNMNFEIIEFYLEKAESCFGFCIKGGKKEPSIISVFHVDKLSPAGMIILISLNVLQIN
jgi:hypothetical protein